VLVALSRVQYYPERMDWSFVQMGESFVSVEIIPSTISSLSR